MGGPRGCRRTGRDQIGDRLCFSKIEPVIEISPLGKFAGPRHSRAEAQGVLHQCIQNNGAAVSLQFRHMLTGVGMRRIEADNESLINRALRVFEDANCGCAGGRQGAREGLRNPVSVGPG